MRGRRGTRRGFYIDATRSDGDDHDVLDGTVALDPTGRRLTLRFCDYPVLRDAGGSVVVGVERRVPIVVMRTGEDAAVALSATCTGKACTQHVDEPHPPPPQEPMPRYEARPIPDGILVELARA